jgi:hypothetical protein
VEAAEGEEALVFDGPLDGFAARESHGLSEGGREVDVPLLASAAFDELDFGRETHVEAGSFLYSSQLTRYQKISQITTKKCRNGFRLVKGQSPAAGYKPAAG